MKIYNYDEQGAFVRESEARQDPRDPSVFLIPARATIVPPPAAELPEIAVWDDGEWKIGTSVIGIKIWDIETRGGQECQTHLVPEGCTDQRPPGRKCTWSGDRWIPDPKEQEEEDRRSKLHATRVVALDRANESLGSEIKSIEALDLLTVLWPVLSENSSDTPAFKRLQRAQKIGAHRSRKERELREAPIEDVRGYDPTTDPELL